MLGNLESNVLGSVVMSGRKNYDKDGLNVAFLLVARSSWSKPNFSNMTGNVLGIIFHKVSFLNIARRYGFENLFILGTTTTLFELKSRAV